MTVPDYGPAFLDCIADAVEAERWQPCVGDALADWWVMVEPEQ